MVSGKGHLILLIGGARSGKSRMALERAESCSGAGLVYIATAEALDEEMSERIARHRTERGPRWRTVEAPLDLPGALVDESASGRVIVVDCLTLWLSNVMLRERDVALATADLLDALAHNESTVLLVSNEVGMGIVPENELARRFRDEAGRLNQAVARAADEVLLVCAGLGLRMK
jgi:adenosylcobinamide kinase/adenosylcobinamide-phosphate guanylyltransferase